MGESHGAGTGTAALGGAAAGLAAAGAAGAVTAGFAAVGGTALGGTAVGGAGFSGGVFVSDWTDPGGVILSAPGVDGSAVGFTSASGGDDEGDLGSSGIARESAVVARRAIRRTLTFISLAR